MSEAKIELWISGGKHLAAERTGQDRITIRLLGARGVERARIDLARQAAESFAWRVLNGGAVVGTMTEAGRLTAEFAGQNHYQVFFQGPRGGYTGRASVHRQTLRELADWVLAD